MISSFSQCGTILNHFPSTERPLWELMSTPQAYPFGGCGFLEFEIEIWPWVFFGFHHFIQYNMWLFISLSLSLSLVVFLSGFDVNGITTLCGIRREFARPTAKSGTPPLTGTYFSTAESATRQHSFLELEVPLLSHAARVLYIHMAALGPAHLWACIDLFHIRSIN